MLVVTSDKLTVSTISVIKHDEAAVVNQQLLKKNKP